MSPCNILDRLVLEQPVVAFRNSTLLQEKCWCKIYRYLSDKKTFVFLNKDKMPFFSKPSVVFEFSCPRYRALINGFYTL